MEFDNAIPLEILFNVSRIPVDDILTFDSRERNEFLTALLQIFDMQGDFIKSIL